MGYTKQACDFQSTKWTISLFYGFLCGCKTVWILMKPADVDLYYFQQKVLNFEKVIKLLDPICLCSFSAYHQKPADLDPHFFQNRV